MSFEAKSVHPSKRCISTSISNLKTLIMKHFYFRLIWRHDNRPKDIRSNDNLAINISLVLVMLSKDKLCYVSLVKVSLSYVSLGYANLGYASLGYASIGYASLSYASLGKVSLGYVI